MSKDKEAKDFQLDELEKPLTEQEMKETTGGAAATPPVLAPGLHVQVIDGLIKVSNPGGSLGFSAGQFGYVPNMNQPPVIVPKNPGIQFTPPPPFQPSSTPNASKTPGSAPGKKPVGPN
jgi:hypothetical protein